MMTSRASKPRLNRVAGDVVPLRSVTRLNGAADEPRW